MPNISCKQGSSVRAPAPEGTDRCSQRARSSLNLQKLDGLMIALDSSPPASRAANRRRHQGADRAGELPQYAHWTTTCLPDWKRVAPLDDLTIAHFAPSGSSDHYHGVRWVRPTITARTRMTRHRAALSELARRLCGLRHSRPSRRIALEAQAVSQPRETYVRFSFVVTGLRGRLKRAFRRHR